MVLHCVVPHCPNREKQNGSKMSYHKFPINDPHLLNQWLLGLDMPDYKPTTTSKICSAHFKSSELNFTTGKNFNLRRFAVPSILPEWQKGGYTIRKLEWEDDEHNKKGRRKKHSDDDINSSSSWCSTCSETDSIHESDSDMFTDHEHTNSKIKSTDKVEGWDLVTHDHFYTPSQKSVDCDKYDKLVDKLKSVRKKLRNEQQITRRLRDRVSKLKKIVDEQKFLLDKL